jgi:hypothetical protein
MRVVWVSFLTAGGQYLVKKTVLGESDDKKGA